MVDGLFQKTFYVEVKPVTRKYVTEALEKTKLTPEYLTKNGLDPAEAMQKLDAWIARLSTLGHPVFASFGTFDWMWVSYYFMTYLGRNPFGINGLDIKSYYAGKFNKRWGETSKTEIAVAGFRTKTKHTHNALDDAKEQAELLHLMMTGTR